MFETRMTWDKLKLELELLATEDPTTIMPLIIGLHSYLWPSEAIDKCFRELNFMGYEIVQLCDGLPESDRQLILNNYFFEQKGFSVSHIENDFTENELNMSNFLKIRNGNPLIVGIVYCHLASLVDLPIYLTSSKYKYLLKWIRGKGEVNFVSLLQEGALVQSNDLVKLMSKSKEKLSPSENDLEILPSKQVFSTYLESLLIAFENRKMTEEVLKVLDVLVCLFPNRLKHLSKRALLLKNTGNHRAALIDLKRYFSFIDRSSASPELKMAFYELQAFHSNSLNTTVSTIH